ncbi:MAG: hypothetical protein LBP19_02055 [Treponema sp.]|jgi:hypothetical protein|nr:hypothetical protein [Treponema sp.]
MADWASAREQDLVDVCEKWKTVLPDSAQVAAYGWEQAEVAAVLGKIDAFLTARSGYEADDSPVMPERFFTMITSIMRSR